MARPALQRSAPVVAGLALAVSALAQGCGSDDDAGTGTASAGTDATQADRGPALDVRKLPLGDGRHRTRPAKGYVFSCQADFQGPSAMADGPWINERGKTWDLTEKIAVAGAVDWKARFSDETSGSERVLEGNGLPPNRTGRFPIQAGDPAYRYDRNPNSISRFTLRASLPANPERGAQINCVGGTVGVAKTGVPLFSAFDAAGNDAPAHEVQDRCEGHPQMTGQYHFHSLSSCVGDERGDGGHSPLIGWALDGFGIYGQYGKGGEQMTTAKLDLCHGHTHDVEWDGKRRSIYHYHATLDFPYLVGCFRGEPISEAEGLQIGQPGEGQGGGPPGPPPGGAPPPP